MRSVNQSKSFWNITRPCITREVALPGYGVTNVLRCIYRAVAKFRHNKIVQSPSTYSLSPGVWQSFVTIRSCNHLMRIISRYVDNTKKSEIS